MADPSSSSAAAARTVPLHLTTHTAYPLPPTRLLTPTTFTRYLLSQLINTSLHLTPPIPFDFLIRGQLLRSSLQAYLDEHGLTGEDVLEVEYVRSILPPQKQAEIEQDDWVSAVSLSLPSCILSGSYDSSVRIYSQGQELLHTLRSHSGPVTAVLAFPAPAQSGMEGHWLASSSQDREVHLYHLPPSSLFSSASPAPDPSNTPKLLTTLHTSPAQVSSVAVSPDHARLVTATWDGVVGLFSTTLPETHELPVEETFEPDGSRTKKRRRLHPSIQNGEAEVFRKAPDLLLRGHQGKVSRAVFGSSGEAGGREVYSAGWDCTVRQWDGETGQQGVVKTTPDRVHLTLAKLASPSALLATGTSTRECLLFDPRSPLLTTMQLLHPGPVNCLAPHERRGELLTTGTLQGVVQIWDLRASKEALVRIQRGAAGGGGGEGGKMLALDWRTRSAGEGAGGEEGIWATGGEDKKVQVFSTSVSAGGARAEWVGKEGDV